MGSFWGEYKLFDSDQAALAVSARCIQVLGTAQLRSVLDDDDESLGSRSCKLYLDVSPDCPMGYVNSSGAVMEPTACVKVAFRQQGPDEGGMQRQFYESQLSRFGCVSLMLLQAVEAGDELYVKY